MRSKRDGQPIPGNAGKITAEEQSAALGIDAAAPKPAPLPPTPNQARKLAADEWPGEGPPDFERSTVSDPEAIAGALGLRQSDFDPPLGSQPEGVPIAAPDFRPKAEARAERTDWDRAPSREEVRRQAEQLRHDAQARVRGAMEMVSWARKHGTPDQKQRAADEAAAEAGVARRIVAGLNKLRGTSS